MTLDLKKQAAELYLLGFADDGRDFAEEFTERFFDENCCYIEENGKLVSMLYMFDCELVNLDKRYPVSYVYAVVTHPSYRGKGYMRKLMEKAKKRAEGKAALIIKPSNKELYSFYEKLGFNTAFYYSECEYFKQDNNDAKITFINSEKYNLKREELLKEVTHVCWQGMMEYIGSNGRFFEGEDFCGLVEEIEDRLFLREFIGDKSRVNALLSHFSKKSAIIRTTGNDTPFGMICRLNNASFPEKMYMGFAMD